jgi:hypothetical protein
MITFNKPTFPFYGFPRRRKKERKKERKKKKKRVFLLKKNLNISPIIFKIVDNFSLTAPVMEGSIALYLKGIC